MLEIGRNRRARIDEQRRKRSFRRRPEPAVSVIQEQLRLVFRRARRQGVSPPGHEQILPPVAPGVEQEQRPVVNIGAGRERRGVGACELSRSPAAQDAPGIEGRPAQDHRVAAAAIDVPHRQSRTPAVEADGDQPLQRILVHRFLARSQRKTGRLAHLGELSDRRRRVSNRQFRRGSRRLRDGETPVDAQVLERLHEPAGPGDREPPDDCVVPQAEMDRGFAARRIPAGEPELAHLHAQGALDPHRRADPETVGNGSAQIDHHAVPRVVVVAEDAYAALIVGVDKIEVAVPAQVSKCGSKTHAFLIEAPGRADVLELQVAEVAEGEMVFDAAPGCCT